MIDSNLKVESFEPVFTKAQLEMQERLTELQEEAARMTLKKTLGMRDVDRARAVAEAIEFVMSLVPAACVQYAFTATRFVAKVSELE